MARRRKMDGTGILFGLGSGRCGTSSLAALMNGQPGVACFHELNPSSMAWSGAEATIGSLMRDFEAILAGEERVVTADLVSPNRLIPLTRLQELSQVHAVGDVGSYYLPYVEMMIQKWPGLRFPCLRRDREEVIASFAAKLAHPSFHATRNHWASQADVRWQRDSIWDRCFPTFEGMQGESLERHIGRYYDLYNEMAESLASRYPNQVRIFSTDDLNTRQARARILEFCLPGRCHVDFEVHHNSRPPDPAPGFLDPT